MKASKVINKKSEILEQLHNVAEELINLDSENKSYIIEYTRLDVIAAVSVFIHILSNKKAHQYYKMQKPIDMSLVRKEMESYGESISAIVKEMSNIDLNEKGDENEQ